MECIIIKDSMIERCWHRCRQEIVGLDNLAPSWRLHVTGVPQAYRQAAVQVPPPREVSSLLTILFSSFISLSLLCFQLCSIFANDSCGHVGQRTHGRCLALPPRYEPKTLDPSGRWEHYFTAIDALCRPTAGHVTLRASLVCRRNSKENVICTADAISWTCCCCRLLGQLAPWMDAAAWRL